MWRLGYSGDMSRGDSGSWSIALERDVDAPRMARRALRAWLADLPDHVREAAEITVSELVSNAVRFGRPPIHVCAHVAGDVLALEVSDHGSDRPRRRFPAEGGGVGLNLVHLLADRVEIDGGRSCVRCEFHKIGNASWSRLVPAAPDQYQVELFRQPGSLRLLLRGDIDVAARPELERLLADLDPSQLDRLVIDLREVTFLDTSMLNMALHFDHWGREHHVAVVFTRGIQAVMLAFQTAGLVHRLTFSDAPED